MKTGNLLFTDRSARFITAISKFIILVLFPVLFSCDDELPEYYICPPGQVVASPYNDPAWHPSGQIIGFNHRPLREIHYSPDNVCQPFGSYIYENDSSGFWLVNSDGTNQRRILPHTLQTPTWSPDGSWIAFTLGAQICIMPFDGEEFDTTAVVQLTSEGRNFFPAWSPDGRRIAYNRSVCNGPNTCGIWLVELTNNVNEFLHSYGNFPHWHPFHDSIIFRTNALTENAQDIGDYLWIFSVLSYSKSLLRFITLPNQDNRYFKYSPDGRTIAFTSQFNTREGTQLCTINGDGSGFKQLTTGGCRGFSWSPDGKIVYVNHDWGGIDETKGTLWTMDANGSNKQQLTYHRATIVH